ncbi:NAD-dependent epimerase/dehydratase family protein [uncultured Oscillibacter sp.]|uniref:NAD-dependent epimerase/dehydratase family protein n=1 Tax=uncultured Oscillibacter sp. TaxID=876091 RepID=UPI0025DB2C47|nr:NAD-dependent epimerase/dehydratase family protein [uncultured Oscillibacter sp.]
MKLFILGGTGVISREIVRQALEQGHEVTIFNRGTRTSPSAGKVRVLTGDRHDKEGFARLMSTVDAEVVIDMICFREEDARQTVETFRHRAKQLIFTSSIAAYDRPYHSFPIRESCEGLRTDPAFQYGFQKAEMERYLQGEMASSPAAITILRPSLTFGAGAANFGMLRQNRNVLRRIREGKPVVMTGEGVIPWSFTFVPDLAAAFLLACGNERTYRDCFHVTNTETVVWEDLYRALGHVAGREPLLYYVPSALLRKCAPGVCEHLNFEKVHFSCFSNEKFQTAAPAYAPKVTLEEGVRQLAQWWEETDFPYDAEKEQVEDRICAAYERFARELETCMGPLN